MIGKRFGKLTVLSVAPKNPQLKSRCIRYICECDCGRIVEVNGNSLRTGHTKTCGKCDRKGAFKDLTGQQFGALTVINKSDKKDKTDRRTLWNCKCICGKTVVVSSHLLTTKSKISCGCLKESSGEYKIRTLLEEMAINFISQYKIQDCKYKRILPFDFAIFNSNNELLCLLEYQGDIHFISTGGWNTKDELKERQKRDKIKEDYCKNNNIKLVKINYRDYNKIDKKYLESVIFND